ncbi:MAG TPA: hypothetical protein VGO51_07435 [Burkholderiaceae bacterium]|nr:hypothetical protein [Burkholderiaceae bacterium]
MCRTGFNTNKGGWMGSFAYDRTGSVRDNPDEKEMLELLQSMAGAGAGQPDVSLNDDDGWSISYGSSKTVIFGNAESHKGPWHMKNVSVEQALALWSLLAGAKLAELQSKPWTPGKG